MNLYFRFLLLLLKRLFVTTPTDPFAPCLSTFRVNLLDLDVNLHMNNGRYFSIMDLGRIDLMLKAKVFWRLAKQGYYPVVSSETIRFKKSLDPFQKFDLITHIETWDEKDFYMSQKFVRDGWVYAEGYIKGRFRQRGRKESVPTRELFAAIGIDYKDSPASELSDLQRQIENLLVQKKNLLDDTPSQTD